jgi:hypothetical protein
MKATPMIFNGEMVQAILREIAASGTGKSQTRRIIKQQPGLVCFTKDVQCKHVEGPEWMFCDIAGYEPLLCPYGQPGDLIYVRETFRLFSHSDECGATDHCSCPPSGTPLYRTDDCDGESKWTPSIHMPRWASRITLEITSVRVERLQDISRADAAAEGVCLPDGAIKPDWLRRDRWPEENFAALWDSIYSNWHDNPWVWVIEFKPHLVNVDAFIKQMEAA